MTAVTWSISNKGTFAALELSGLRRRLMNESNDVVFFEAPAAAIDGTALFSYGETVTIKRDSATWFSGRCITIPREGSSIQERISYELVGPWWYLENIIYQQKWNMLNGSSVLEKQYKSRVILCQDQAGVRITSGAQITDIIDFAITAGAPIQRGTIDPAINLPWDECVDISCAEAIVKMLRFSPDCNAFFDYTTTPATLHVMRRANLAAVTVDIDAGYPLNKLAITPRYDLQIPGCVIRFEQTSEIDGETYESVTAQTAGTTTAFNTLVATIQLGGSRMTTVSEKIVVGDYPTDAATARAFLIAHDAYIQDLQARVPDDWSVVANSWGMVNPHAHYLVSGTIQDWMGPTITSGEDLAGAQVEIIIRNSANAIVCKERAWRLIKMTGTNATSKTYRKVLSFESAEAIPSGVAAALYAAWNQLQYEGKFTLIHTDCPSAITPGTRFNITGGLAEWASMNALIQQVEEYVDEGQTEVIFGPAKHLGPEDLVTLLTAFRTRRVSGSYLGRTTGKTKDTGGGNIALGGDHPKQAAAAGPSIPLRDSWRQATGNYTQAITADPADISKTDSDVELKAREVAVINAAGTEIKKRQVICSDVYGDEIGATQTVVTSVRYDATTHQIQVKTRALTVIAQADESDWTMITGGQAEECS